jgi:hypothetical protein
VLFYKGFSSRYALVTTYYTYPEPTPEWPRACRWASDARRWASDETWIAHRAFPADCPWSQAELLDPDFLPDG